MKNAFNMYTILSSPYQYLPLIHRNEEWNGAKPQKWTGSLKTFAPIPLAKPNEKSFIQQKIRVVPPKSNEYVFRPHMKKVHPISRVGTIYRNRRHLTPSYSTVPERHRKNLSSTISSGEQRICSIGIVPKTKRMISSEEISIEDMMSRKKRMLVRPTGGEYYTNRRGVEYEPGFYEKGGLIPGSTNVLNHNKSCSINNQNSYETIDIAQKVLDPKKKWRYRSVDNILQRDIKYVINLENVDKEYYDTAKEKKTVSKNARNTSPNKRVKFQDSKQKKK